MNNKKDLQANALDMGPLRIHILHDQWLTAILWGILSDS